MTGPAGSPTSPSAGFDVLIRGGTIYDGSGGEPVIADLGINGERIVRIGSLADATAGEVIDARGLAVAPGFINMLSHSYLTMLHDPRSLSELLQGVTTQVFGEGTSMGPLNDDERRRLQESDPALTYEVAWDSLAGYLQYAEHKGVSQNVCSYIGATSLRIYVAGHENRPLTTAELDTVRGLIRDEMSAGALGIGSALVYPPAYFAGTDELIAMCAATAPYQGKYISHMRHEDEALLEGIDELVQISREAGVPAEAYHLKASGQRAWSLMEPAIARIESARAAGLPITADMYTYTAGATGLSSCIPPWFHEGGLNALVERLGDERTRNEIRRAIEGGGENWENFYRNAATPENILILQTRRPELRGYQGKTLGRIAAEEGTDPIDTLMNLVARDHSRIGTAYFLMSEENVRLGLQQSWVSLGSDAGSMAAEGVFLTRATHPRAYGNFARLLGRYVREERALSLQEAVRRLSCLPADNLGLYRRGRLQEGYCADVVVFDPSTVADHATYTEPHQYATGIRDVLVNGRTTVRDGAFTGTLAGKALYGPGKVGRQA